jgi:MFS transporter, SP family, solute carrier family 2 (facilitated glucose transporter), member 3
MHAASSVDVEDPLLRGFEDEQVETHTATVTIPQLLKAPELRRPLFIVSLAMTAQQVSGTNFIPPLSIIN